MAVESILGASWRFVWRRLPRPSCHGAEAGSGIAQEGVRGEHTEGREDQVIRMLPITTICAKRTCWIHSLEATRPHLRPRPKPLVEDPDFPFTVNHFRQKRMPRCHFDVDLLTYEKGGKESCRYRSQ